MTNFVRSWRTRRLRLVVAKSRRECADFTRFHKNGCYVVCRREWDTAAMRRALTDPDASIDRGILLKDGNSTTIAHVAIDGRQFVVKRYNPIRIRKFLRQLFLLSRARIAWKNASLFEACGIPTARGVALIERRYTFWRPTTYLVTEFIPGTSGKTLFKRSDHSAAQADDLATATAAALDRLHKAHLSHGDLKVTNLIYGDGIDGDKDPVFIDLDAARRHRVGFFERRRQFRDRQRLLENFAENSLFDLSFRRRMGEGRRAS